MPSTTFRLGGTTPVHRIGYGAMHLTGKGMWGPPEDPDNAVQILRHAVHELGVNFLDTADSYGPGYNEEIIRTALHPYPENLVISTKGGMLRTGPDDWEHADGRAPYIMALGRPEYLRQQVEVSLLRLGTDTIGLYQLHRIDHRVPLAEQLGVLGELQAEGKIRHIGLSGQPGVTIEQLEQARAIVKIDAVENLFNIADRSGEAVLDYAEQHGIAFVPWFPLGHGGLVGPDGVLSKASGEFGATAAQLGLAWLLRRSPNTLLIPGTTNPRHLEENLAATDVTLTESQWGELERLASTITPWRPEAPEERPGAGSEHPNCATIRTLYQDLTQIGSYAADDIVYHVAARDTAAGAADLHGKKAVVASEEDLARRTGGTLRTEVESVVANDEWGTIIGVFHFEAGDQAHQMPFCGLWKFRDGLVTHHWQNAYDPEAMGRILAAV